MEKQANNLFWFSVNKNLDKEFLFSKEWFIMINNLSEKEKEVMWKYLNQYFKEIKKMLGMEVAMTQNQFQKEMLKQLAEIKADIVEIKADIVEIKADIVILKTAVIKLNEKVFGVKDITI
ncbi:hypothetical protein [[Acholeplasma] multilocale]|uniref:hypothetical protein n=1 Tax=[Acholeplasma] multilocale TaxID=264638 RepID=UPI000479174A|nr:hypothetical protein [[Acholeplasma] multilocale]